MTLNAISWVNMAKWPWRSRSMTPIFNTSWENPKMHIWCKFGDFVQIHYNLSNRKVKFPRILCQNGQNDLEYQGQWPPFSIPAKSIPQCMFGAYLVILAQICDKLSWGQAKFPRIRVKIAKMTLKVKVSDPYFQCQLRVSTDACLVQIWWFQLKSVTSHHANKVRFTD